MSTLAIVLLFVFIQDIKNRSIHIILPVLVFGIAMVINYLSVDLNFKDIAYNSAFILINIIGIVIYFSIKNKALINPIDTVLGLGDVVFFIAITPLFSFRTYILFFIIGLMFSLIAHGVYTLFAKSKTIPLAGYLALFLILNLFIKYILKIDLIF
jgi:hypothetical protein